MSRRTCIATLGVVLLLLASASSVLAGSARPWAGHAEGQSWFDLDNPKACDAGITTRVEEPAIASHVGAGFLVLAHCPTGDPADNYHDADLTLYAADGDAIIGEYRGTLDVFVEEVGSEITSTIDLTITGGTGRFDGASGSAVMVVHAIFEGWDDMSWAWSASWEGTLTY